MDYVNNKLPVEKVKAMSKDLFMRYVGEEWRKDCKTDKCALIEDYLILNELGDVVTCCNLPTYHPEHRVGNILKDDIKEILKKKVSMPICSECLSLGIHGDIDIPVFYHLLTKKNS